MNLATTTVDVFKLKQDRVRTVMIGNDEYLFQGWAESGVLESYAQWTIKRVVLYANGDINSGFAGGNASFNQVWVDRESLSLQV
ncbi:MAG: hypothetical protein HQL71_13505 [Magnetococcales bacterium]|nr:hypothetical protein [Magnetococcales bacterium]